MTELDIKTNYEESVTRHPDVCIIGSGAGGSAVAHTLTNKGKSVVILEAGNYYPEEYVTAQSREDVLLNLWKNHGVFLANDFSLNVSQGQCVGGSTMINYGICFRIPPRVLQKWRNDFGITLSDEEINQTYDKVEDIYGVTGIQQEGRSHTVLRDGCNDLEYSHGWMQKALRGDKKQNALITFLENSNKEKLEIFANCKAESVTKDGNKILSVKGIATDPDTKIKHNVEVFADKIVLAAGPIASSEFLLKNNLSNGNKKVGERCSLHPSSSIVAEFSDPINGQDSSVMAYYCDEFSIMQKPNFGFIIESIFVAPSQFSLIMPSFGMENLRHVQNYDKVAMAGVLVHDDSVGKIKLNKNKDATLDYTLHKDDQKKMIKGLREAVRIYLHAGASKVITGHIDETIIEHEDEIESKIPDDSAGQAKLLVLSAHPQGGNIMGEDTSKSVVNSYCKSHQIDNLYVCDASVFPTSVGINPQLTVLMLATIASENMY